MDYLRYKKIDKLFLHEFVIGGAGLFFIIHFQYNHILVMPSDFTNLQESSNLKYFNVVSTKVFVLVVYYIILKYLI